MKALVWHGKSDIRRESVPDPKIEDARDAIIRVTACAICGSRNVSQQSGRMSQSRAHTLKC